MGADVMMQNTLMTFKRDILKLVGETMENKLKSFSDLISQQSRPVAHTESAINVPHAHQSNTGVTKAYNKAVSTAPNSHSEPQPTDFPHLNDVYATPPARKSEKHVLLLKPTNEESMSTASEKKKSLNSVYKAVTDINVEFCSVKKSGVIAIGFPDSDSMKLAEDKIKNDQACSSTFTADNPKKLLPKVTVKGINEILFDSCNNDDRDEMKAVLLKDILLRNKGIQNIIDSDTKEFVDVVAINKFMPSISTVG